MAHCDNYLRGLDLSENLLGPGQVDQVQHQPADQSWPKLTQVLQVQQAQARIQLPTEIEVVQSIPCEDSSYETWSSRMIEHMKQTITMTPTCVAAFRSLPIWYSLCPDVQIHTKYQCHHSGSCHQCEHTVI